MAIKRVGIGSQYAAAVTDSHGKPLDGSKAYKIHAAAQHPGEGFLVPRRLRQPDPLDAPDGPAVPEHGSETKGMIVNADKSVDVWFGPTAPKGHEANWVQTVPGKGWNVILRLYGPLESWFGKAWKPGEFELVN
jgi:hypothetical protein